MNAFWKTLLGSVTRTVVASASGYAVAKGTISAGDAQMATDVVAAVASGNAEVVSGAIGVGVIAAWSIWQKVRARGR